MRRLRDEQEVDRGVMDDFVEELSRRMAARLSEDLRRMARLVRSGALEQKLVKAKRKSPRRRVAKKGPPFRLVHAAGLH